MGLAKAGVDSFLKELQKNFNEDLALIKSALAAGA